MLINLKKFINKHFPIVLLFIFNISQLIIFTIIYFLCIIFIENSFVDSLNNPIKKNDFFNNLINTILYTISIQTGSGTSSLKANNNLVKTILIFQQILILISTLIIAYLFVIYYLIKKKK